MGVFLSVRKRVRDMRPEKRPIYDAMGNEIGRKSVLFGELPEDYEFRDCTQKLSVLNLTSELTAMNSLLKKGTISDIEYQIYSFYELALDYIVSADKLRESFHDEIKTVNGVHLFKPRVFIPCAYACRHAIELLLKYAILLKTRNLYVLKSNHWIEKLWVEFQKHYTDERISKLQRFIDMLKVIDDDGIKLRYGFDKSGIPYPIESYSFDIDILMDNTGYFFDIVDEIIRE